MNSGFVYEILMYLNPYYFAMYASFKAGVSVLKSMFLPYEEHTLIREAIVLILFCFVETMRTILGRRSSLSDHDTLDNPNNSFPKAFCLRCWQAFVSLILTLPSLAIILYMCWFHAYVLKLEILLSALMIALQCAQIVSALIFICYMYEPVVYT